MTDWPIDQERITDWLKRMIAIDSVNPTLVRGGAGETEMVRWLLERCIALGLEWEMQALGADRANLIARWPGSGGGRRLLLTGHTDTVGIDGMINPLKAQIDGGKVYGRGALDMKGGLAAILGAVLALRSAGFEPRGDLILGFVADEENRSIGTEALVEVVKADAALLAEPSGMEVCVAHRGYAWLTITTHGQAAHGSLYEVGVDAIAHMGRVLAELDRMNTVTLAKRQHEWLGRPSAHASLIEGGIGPSTYPDRCQLQIEHRLLPDETGENVLALWQGALGRLAAADPAFNAEVTLDFWRPGYELDPGEAIVETLSEAYEAVQGRAPQIIGQLAWLDSALLAEAGIPTVILGPRGAGMHAREEYVELADVFACASIYAETAARWTG